MKPVPKESLAQLVLKVPLVPPVRREREEPEESLELLDHSDLPEREELLVTVVSQVRTVWLVLRVPPEIVVFLELVDLRVLLGILVALASPASPEPGVSLDVLEMLVLRAKLDLLVLLEKMVVLGLLVLRELVDSQESWDSPDPREPMVNLEKLVRKALWVALV